MAGLTPLGPLPEVTRGCNVAAPRCHCGVLGVAVADPPPRVHLFGGLPVLRFSLLPFFTRPRSEFLRRILRGVHFAPPLWAPSTCGLGHCLGAEFNISPHPLSRHVSRVSRRCCGTAGGVFDGLAPLRQGAAGIFFR